MSSKTGIRKFFPGIWTKPRSLTGARSPVGNDWVLGTVDIRHGSSLIAEASGSLTLTAQDGSNQNLKLREGDSQLTVYGHVQTKEAEFGRGNVADGDVANVLIDGGSVVSSGMIILSRGSSLSEFTLTNGAMMQAEDWFDQYFTPEELDDEGISGLGATPAGAGVPNAVKFLMGLDPKVPSREALPVESVQDVDDADYLTLTFTVMNDVAAEWGVQATGALGDWPDSAVEVEELRSVDESAGTTTYTYPDVVPLEDADSRFLRMWVDVNE